MAFEAVVGERIYGLGQHAAFPWDHDFPIDGQLDQKELKRAFDLVGRPTSEEAIERAIKELDQNNDGLVNLQEFKAIAWATAVDSTPETGAAAA